MNAWTGGAGHFTQYTQKIRWSCFCSGEFSDFLWIKGVILTDWLYRFTMFILFNNYMTIMCLCSGVSTLFWLGWPMQVGIKYCSDTFMISVSSTHTTYYSYGMAIPWLPCSFTVFESNNGFTKLAVMYHDFFIWVKGFIGIWTCGLKTFHHSSKRLLQS